MGTFISENILIVSMKVLFVCNQNKYRSPTAEALFKESFETRSAGLFGGKLVSKDDLSWADIIAVMEEEQRHELVKRFPAECLQKRLVCLNISDVYGFNEQRLKDALLLKSDELTIQ